MYNTILYSYINEERVKRMDLDLFKLEGFGLACGNELDGRLQNEIGLG